MKDRLQNIDFLRFLFAVILCCAHLLMGLANNNPILQKMGSLALYPTILTDFFFIVSGYFFVVTWKDVTFFEFVKKKLQRLWLLVLFSTSLYYIISLYHTYNINPVELFSMSFFISSFGFWTFWGYTAWFTSVLFWGFILFFIIKKNIQKQNILNFIVFVLSLLSYYLLISTWNSVGGTSQLIYFISSGMLRAIGGLGCGIMVANFCNKYSLENLYNSKVSSVFIGIFESFVFSFIIYFTIISPTKIHRNYIFIAMFVIITILFVYRKGFLSKLLDNKISSFLGRYSFSFYLMHYPVMYYIASFFWYHNVEFANKYPFTTLFLLVSFIFLISMFVYHFIEQKHRYRKQIITAVILFIALPVIILNNMPVNYDEIYKFDTIHPRIKLTNVSDVYFARWSSQDTVKLSFKQKDNIPTKLQISLYADCDKKFPNQVIEVYVDNKLSDKWIFENGKVYQKFISLSAKIQQNITFVTKDIKHNSQTGGGQFPKLGIVSMLLKQEK